MMAPISQSVVDDERELRRAHAGRCPEHAGPEEVHLPGAQEWPGACLALGAAFHLADRP